MVAHSDWRSLMARCTTCMRQPGKPETANPRNPGSIVAHVLRADDHSNAVQSESLFLKSTHLTLAWGERVESLNAARGTQHSSTREFNSHTTIQAMSCLKDRIGREHRYAFEAHFNHGNGHVRGGMDSGSVVRRQANARRRATTAVTEPNHAAPHRARCESFFTSSCPATPSSVVAGAFPPRSPGGRRSAWGFSVSTETDKRDGSVLGGEKGTPRRKLLVGGTLSQWADRRRPNLRFGPSGFSAPTAHALFERAKRRKIGTWCRTFRGNVVHLSRPSGLPRCGESHRLNEHERLANSLNLLAWKGVPD